MENLKLTSREENYSEWYNQLVLRAELADYAPVRGCMVVRPYGWALWENIQAALDKRFKETGHVNAAFPMLIPESYMTKEAEHVEGFSPELAVVTHAGGSKLEEPLVVRPTSETIIGTMYAKWIQSYRDLPVLMNQWANVVRWEMRTRLFLRTAEFLWQEGHTAHATEKEAIVEAEKMMNVYADFAENFMAIPVVKGTKTESERFAGALETYCIEALMQDGKALQAGTSHFLGQNFAKAFDVKFADKDGKLNYVWATSWGVSTRLIGALIMTHSDDNGLVLPPNLAPDQVVIVPIYRKEEEFEAVNEVAENLMKELRSKGIRVKYDNRDTHKPGWKFNEYELKGVPVRIAIGPKDVEKGTVELARRDTLTKEFIKREDVVEKVVSLMTEIQDNLFKKASAFRDEHITEVSSYDEFKEVLKTKGGFVLAHWDGTAETEEMVKNETKATIRCIPLDGQDEAGTCVFTGKPSSRKVLFAQAY